MKEFILKNIVLTIVLGATLVGSLFLIFFIWEKRQTIQHSMRDIMANVETVRSINAARNPNSVEQSEKMIKADTDTLNKKINQVYRHFGKPYRPALLKFLKNIASPAELKTDLPVDPTLVAKPKPIPEPEENDEDGEEEVAEAKPAAPEAPTDEEKAVFDPGANLVVLSFDEDTLRAKLADLYKEVHQNTTDDTFVIPDTIQSERAQLFEKLFNQMIEAPEAVNPARSEDFRKAAAAKFAQAFAIFRDEVQALTLEDVTDKVAHELFLDALGLPRLMRQRDCKNYIDFLYEKYYASDIIPGLSEDNQLEKEKSVQDFIYGKNLNRQALPVPEMVIPIIRNFQIKEDLFRRMKVSGISRLISMNAGVFYGSSLDNDADGPILAFTYTLEMMASMEAIEAFVNSLHSAYKTDRVYVIKSIKLSSSADPLLKADGIVASHMSDERPSTLRTGAQSGPDAKSSEKDVEEPNDDAFDPANPHHSDYGRVLIGEKRDDVKCTLVVNYLFYRADNITPQ